MSKHAKPTLVRCYRGEAENIANILVDDWETRDGRAQFTMPRGESVPDMLFDTTSSGLRLIVMASDEVLWAVNRMEASARWGWVYRVTCTALAKQIRDTWPTDDWITTNTLNTGGGQ